MSEALAEDVGTEDVPVVEEAPVVEAPLAPAYDPTEDPRVLDLVRNQAAQIADERMQALIREAQTQAQTPQGPSAPVGLVDEYGNLDPSALATFLQQRDEQMFQQLDQRFQQIAQPLQAREQAETIAEGEQRITDMIADDIARNGDFPTDPDTGKSAAKELIRPLADALFPSVAQTYGVTPRAAEMAVTKASTLVREIIEQSGKAAVNAHVNRNTTLATAPGEPGAGTPGLAVRPEGPYKPGELSMKYGANASRIAASGA